MILNFISNFITHTGTLYFSFRYKPNSHSVRRLRPLDPNRDSPLYSTKVLNWSLGPQSFSNMNFYIKLRSLIVHFVLLKCSRPRTFRGLRPLDPTGVSLLDPSWSLPLVAIHGAVLRCFGTHHKSKIDHNFSPLQAYKMPKTFKLPGASPPWTPTGV